MNKKIIFSTLLSCVILFGAATPPAHAKVLTWAVAHHMPVCQRLVYILVMDSPEDNLDGTIDVNALDPASQLQGWTLANVENYALDIYGLLSRDCLSEREDPFVEVQRDLKFKNIPFDYNETARSAYYQIYNWVLDDNRYPHQKFSNPHNFLEMLNDAQTACNNSFLNLQYYCSGFMHINEDWD